MENKHQILQRFRETRKHRNENIQNEDELNQLMNAVNQKADRAMKAGDTVALTAWSVTEQFAKFYVNAPAPLTKDDKQCIFGYLYEEMRDLVDAELEYNNQFNALINGQN